MLASAVLATSSAFAFVFDQAKIVIDRALSSPTVTIRYSGANAAVAEMRVNGVSFGTRQLDATRASGETNFTLEASALREGDNQIEVRLFDKSGKLIGTERQLVVTESSFDSLVSVTSPKMGASVRGSVQISVNISKPMRNAYVSFFIDNQWKSMSNVPPFNFIWDTEREQNGWHEIEAWVVDDANQTLKTKKIKVFVENPGGNTERRAPRPKPEPTMNGNPIRNAIIPAAGEPKPEPKPAKEPIATNPIGNEVKGMVGQISGAKPSVPESAIMTGSKAVAPETVAVILEPAPQPLTKAIDAGASLIAITRGTRLPDSEAFSVVLNGNVVNFDVQPRIKDGVPLTPFRHLFEANGGKVDWNNTTKTVNASGSGKDILIQIGDTIARVNNMPVAMEIAAFIEKGRTIVPLSFIHDALEVDVDYDKATGHVLISSAKKP
jgi:hypothetical protein